MKLALALIATATLLASTGSLAAGYKEKDSGDLSDDGKSPTTVELKLGANVISGRFGAKAKPAGTVVDRDYFTVKVPSGQQLSAVTLGSKTVTGSSAAFIGVQSGKKVTAAPDGTSYAALLGWADFSAADAGKDLLPRIGTGAGAKGFVPPLGPGTYSFWVQDTSVCDCNYAFTFQVTKASSGSERGAYLMPYTRYEADVATLSNATVMQTTDFDWSTIASEASEQKYVNLPGAGSSVEWTVSTAGNGVTLRYTMPDSSDGHGLDGEVDVYVNGKFDKTVAVTSRWAWQYFVNQNPDNQPHPLADTDYIAMRFDETHFMLNQAVKPGDRIRIQKKTNDGNAYGIDFIELESVPDKIAKPAGYVSIADFGGVPNDGKSDLPAFNAALAAAAAAGTGVYLPAGQWDFDDKVVLTTSNIGIKGAGMWYTNVNYSNPAQFSGGILARATNVEVSDIYFSTVNNSRMCMYMACPYGGPYMIYKAFMGTWGKNSKFTRVWAEHFEVGAWIGGYDQPYPVDVTDGLVISEARFRNNYADGVNFSQGTSNSVVEQTNIRNSGDDGLAMWPSNSPAVPEEVDNEFRYDTVENVFRAGGVAIFGGKDHTVRNMLIRDCFGGSAIRFTNDFPGYTYDSAGLYHISDVDISACGTSNDLWHQKRGAVEFFTPSGVFNLQFDNISIRKSPRFAVQMVGNNFQNITFNNTTIDGTGLDPTVRDVAANVWGGVGLYAEANSGGATFNNVYIGNMEDANSVNQNPNFNLVANFLPLPKAAPRPVARER